MQREEDMLDKRKNSIVLDIARFTEGLLQFLLYILFLVKQVYLGFLRLSKHKNSNEIFSKVNGEQQ